MTKPQQLFVEALRSGEYQQSFGRLRTADRFCALGVGVDVYLRVKGEGWRQTKTQFYFVGESWNYCTAPDEVCRFFGLEGTSHRFLVPGSPFRLTLIIMNDGERFSFEKIADVLEANWK